MGAPAFAAALASTFWGSLASRFSPKTLFMSGLLSHAVIILLMGFVSSLPVLLVLRIIQGILGGISTVGLIIVSSSSSREWAARDIGLYQNAMTLGQLIGPPIGALAATTLGYQGAFISASALVLVTLAFCFFYVKEFPHESTETTAPTKHSMNKKTLIAWGLCFTVNVQLMFLPSVLPNVFRGFHMEESMAVKSAGLVVMLYTATAMAGTFLLCRLAARVTSHRLIIYRRYPGNGFAILAVGNSRGYDFRCCSYASDRHDCRCHAFGVFVVCLGFGRTGDRVLEFKQICRQCAGTDDRNLCPCLFKLELALYFCRQHQPAGLGQLCILLCRCQEY